MKYVMVGEKCNECKGTGITDGQGFGVVYTPSGRQTICPSCQGNKIIGEMMPLSQFASLIADEMSKMSRLHPE